jgi:hypothetical protein
MIRRTVGRLSIVVVPRVHPYGDVHGDTEGAAACEPLTDMSLSA